MGVVQRRSGRGPGGSPVRFCPLIYLAREQTSSSGTSKGGDQPAEFAGDADLQSIIRDEVGANPGIIESLRSLSGVDIITSFALEGNASFIPVEDMFDIACSSVIMSLLRFW